MNKVSTAVTVHVLALVALVGVIVLAATSRTVPAELWTITVALVGGSLGIALPSASTTTASSTPATSAPTPGAPLP